MKNCRRPRSQWTSENTDPCSPQRAPLPSSHLIQTAPVQRWSSCHTPVSPPSLQVKTGELRQWTYPLEMRLSLDIKERFLRNKTSLSCSVVGTAYGEFCEVRSLWLPECSDKLFSPLSEGIRLKWAWKDHHSSFQMVKCAYSLIKKTRSLAISLPRHPSLLTSDTRCTYRS